MTIALTILLAALSGFSETTSTHQAPLEIPKPPVAPPRILTPAWEVAVPNTAVPLITGMEETFAVATRDGRITGHRLDTGERLWENDLGSPLAAPPLFIDGVLAIALSAAESSTTDITFLDPLTGISSSRLAVTPPVVNPSLTAVSDGLVVTGLFDGTLGVRLYEVRTGTLRWHSQLTSAASAPVAQCNGSILIGGSDGVLTALSSRDGSKQWIEKLPGAITTPAVCDGRRAWVGSADNHIHALSIKRHGCRHRWSYPTGGDIAGRVILFNQNVSFFSYDTYLYSLDADNGHLEWKVRLGRRPQSDSVLVDGILVLAQLNTERMELFSLADGGQTASLTLTGGAERFVTPPTRAGRMVVIGAARYGEESARILGIAPLTDLPAASPVSADR